MSKLQDGKLTTREVIEYFVCEAHGVEVPNGRPMGTLATALEAVETMLEGRAPTPELDADTASTCETLLDTAFAIGGARLERAMIAHYALDGVDLRAAVVVADVERRAAGSA